MFLMICLCNFSRELSAFACASPQVEMQYSKCEYIKDK